MKISPYVVLPTKELFASLLIIRLNNLSQLVAGSACRERIDLYFFDRGHGSDYFCTTDCQPQLHTDRLARDTADAATRLWAEAYGSVHIVVAIAVAFVLQSLRFVLYSVVRPLLVGSIQIVGDYVIKPLLAACFNGCIQPPLVFTRNVLESLADLLRPVCSALGRLLEPLASTLGALRLVEIHHYHSYPGDRERDETDAKRNIPMYESEDV